jgi:hypothetical protein
LKEKQNLSGKPAEASAAYARRLDGLLLKEKQNLSGRPDEASAAYARRLDGLLLKEKQNLSVTPDEASAGTPIGWTDFSWKRSRTRRRFGG